MLKEKQNPDDPRLFQMRNVVKAVEKRVRQARNKFKPDDANSSARVCLTSSRVTLINDMDAENAPVGVQASIVRHKNGSQLVHYHRNHSLARKREALEKVRKRKKEDRNLLRRIFDWAVRKLS